MSDFAEASSWVSFLLPWVIRVALAVVIFFVGRKLAKWLSDWLAGQLKKQDLDDMLIRLVKNSTYVVLLGFVVLAALEQLGINTTSALAVFGAAGLAVGLAVKDSLSNFAAGVMIVFFRPFTLGHFIEAAGSSGTVVEVGLFNTTLLTPDNKRIVIPNRLVYNETIVNYSAEDTRRVDLVFGIGYDDDISKARQIIESIMAEDERILKDPAPAVVISALADSSVNFAVRPWVKGENYWGVHNAMLEKVKLAFDEYGISIPYPQQDIHMHPGDAKVA